MKFWWVKPKKDKEDPQPTPVVVGTPLGEGELDIYSPTWVFLTAYFHKEIQRLRERNDSVTLSPEQTAAIRGEIKALRRLSTLPEDMKRHTGLMAIPEEE